MIEVSRDGAFAQGDCVFVPVDKIPKRGVSEQKHDGAIVVAHSETGHHHVIESAQAKLFASANPMICYLRCEGFVELEHRRPWDTHETIRIPPGNYKVLRQREGAPEGWRRVED